MLYPNYKRIYTDILRKKFPHKIKECASILKKENLFALDIIQLNNTIFSGLEREKEIINQKFRSYTPTDIAKILSYQDKSKLNNTQVAKHFKISRNTLAKWKKHFKSFNPTSDLFSN